VLAAWESAALALSLPLSSAFLAVSPTEVQAAFKASPWLPPISLALSVQAETAESTDCSALDEEDEPDDPLEDESSSSPHPTASKAQTANNGTSENRSASMCCGKLPAQRAQCVRDVEAPLVERPADDDATQGGELSGCQGFQVGQGADSA
jgi:hypothetical protein